MEKTKVHRFLRCWKQSPKNQIASLAALLKQAIGLDIRKYEYEAIATTMLLADTSGGEIVIGFHVIEWYGSPDLPHLDGIDVEVTCTGNLSDFSPKSS